MGVHDDARREMIGVKITSIFGMRLSGALNKKVIASSWKGHQYLKAYAKPRNPNTKEQQRQRATFKAAVEAWRGLTGRQREFYNGMAEGISGYNLFVGRYLDAVRGGGKPEVPAAVTWNVLSRRVSRSCVLVVRRGARHLYTEQLRGRKGEFALTSSDAPYVFAIKEAGHDETVFEFRRLLPSLEILKTETLRVRLRVREMGPPRPAGGR